MLDILAAALIRNAVKFEVLETARLKGSKALARFRNDVSVRALLLLLKNGAQGLTLTEASHVILLEPVLNPAVEAQAINRIHRIGQTRSTRVYRLLIH